MTLEDYNEESGPRLKLGLAAGMVKSYAQMPTRIVGIASHITFGSFTFEEKLGNPEPTYYFDEETQVSINAVGLTNEGLLHFLDHCLGDIHQRLKETDTELCVSIAPLKEGDARAMCEMINKHPWAHFIDVLEINGACPNHRSEGRLHEVLAKDVGALERLMDEASVYSGKKRIKIAPETESVTLKAIPILCSRYGFYAIVSGNTLLGSSVIKGEQRLSVEKGGRAGSILFEKGVEQVRALSLLCKGFDDVTVIACGGVMSGSAYHAYREAGASDVQLATGYMQQGPKIFQNIALEYAELCAT